MWKQGSAVSVMVAVLAGCAEVTDPNEALPIAEAVSPACADCTFGPVTIVKAGSGTVNRTLHFVANPSELHAVELTWQAPAGSVAIVWFNGSPLATIKGGGAGAAVRHFVVTVTRENAMRVKLEGAAGSQLIVRVLRGFDTTAGLDTLIVPDVPISRDDPPGNVFLTIASLQSQVMTSTIVVTAPFFPVRYYWQHPTSGEWHVIGTASLSVFDQGSNRFWRYILHWDPSAPVPTNTLVKVLGAGIDASGVRAMTEPILLDIRP
jgi:hypothetical protein